VKSILFFTSVNTAYFLVIFIIATVLMDFLKSKISFFSSEKVSLLLSIFFFFIFSFNAWKINLFTVTGIYFAGLFISKTDYRNPVEETIKVSQLLFVPFFFIFAGVSLNLKNISLDFYPFIIFYSLVALAGKIFGCGIIAKFFGFDFKRSFRIGCGMAPRGEIALIIASIAFYYSDGKFIGEADFISVVIMVTSSILIIQYLMMFLYKDRHKGGFIKGNHFEKQKC
jgi:Kef-type K+ transport system membrane component KefB